jgi:hypothetical protein
VFLLGAMRRMIDPVNDASAAICCWCFVSFVGLGHSVLVFVYCIVACLTHGISIFLA